MNYCTIIENGKLFINNVEMPDLPNGEKPNHIVQKNGIIYVNGYEMKEGKWKKTVRAMWNCFR